jgi:hypothetical protein
MTWVECQSVRPSADTDFRRTGFIARSEDADRVLTPVRGEYEVPTLVDQGTCDTLQVLYGSNVTPRSNVDHVHGIIRRVRDIEKRPRTMHRGMIESAWPYVLREVDEAEVLEMLRSHGAQRNAPSGFACATIALQYA